MATITLTDRISVRVTAKDSTETSNQNKTNGNNVAKSLTGDSGTSLTDSAAEAVGAALGDTVTGEDGKQYAKIHGVMNAIKAAVDSGEIPEGETIYDGITDQSGHTWLVQPSYEADGMILHTYRQDIDFHLVAGEGLMIAFISEDNEPGSRVQCYVFSKTQGKICWINVWQDETYKSGGNGVSTNSSSGATIDSDEYTIYTGWTDMYNSTYGTFVTNESLAASGYSKLNNGIFTSKDAAGTLFGDTHKGGPKVDTTKSDQEIADDINRFAELNDCKMTSESGDTYIAVTDANGNPLYFLGA